MLLEEFDKVTAAGEPHALTDALDGVVAEVGGVIHAAACLADAVVGQQGGEGPVGLLIDGL